MITDAASLSRFDFDDDLLVDDHVEHLPCKRLSATNGFLCWLITENLPPAAHAGRINSSQEQSPNCSSVCARSFR